MKWWVPVGLLLALAIMPRRIMAAIKEGVDFGGQLKPTTQKIIDSAERAFGHFGIRPTITSGVDGTHKANSKHYTGDALDWRTWESNAKGVTDQVADYMRYDLGAAYYIEVEDTHIHSQYNTVDIMTRA